MINELLSKGISFELLSKEISFELLAILLIDRTTNKNIVWGTTDYDECSCQAEQEIQLDEIGLIRPRYEKIREWQKTRTRDRAEIFTPSWLCNEQNNLGRVGKLKMVDIGCSLLSNSFYQRTPYVFT